MIRDHDRARLFGHLRSRHGSVGGLLLRDDRVVAQLFQLLELGVPALTWAMAGASGDLRRDPTHGSVYTEKP